LFINRGALGTLERTADYKLQDMLLTNIHHSASHNATEAVTGDYAKIEFTGASGTSGGTLGGGKGASRVTASSFSLRRH
jgi:type VI protein secretion system component Hcp